VLFSLAAASLSQHRALVWRSFPEHRGVRMEATGHGRRPRCASPSGTRRSNVTHIAPHSAGTSPLAYLRPRSLERERRRESSRLLQPPVRSHPLGDHAGEARGIRVCGTKFSAPSSETSFRGSDSHQPNGVDRRKHLLAPPLTLLIPCETRGWLGCTTSGGDGRAIGDSRPGIGRRAPFCRHPSRLSPVDGELGARAQWDSLLAETLRKPCKHPPSPLPHGTLPSVLGAACPLRPMKASSLCMTRSWTGS
jgi:hypothetical protein